MATGKMMGKSIKSKGNVYNTTSAAIKSQKKQTKKNRNENKAYRQYEKTTDRIKTENEQELLRLDQEYDSRRAENDALWQSNYEAYAQQSKENAEKQKQYYQRMYDENSKNINTNYDRSANTAYINYRQGQKALPEQLSQYGVSGGASESANLKLQAAYGSNLANNEFYRNSDIANARQNMITGMNDIDSVLNASLASAYAENMANRANYAQELSDYYAGKKEAQQLDFRNRMVENKANLNRNLGLNITEYTDPNTGRLHTVNTTISDRNKEAKAKEEADAANKAAIDAFNEAVTVGTNLINAGYTVGWKSVNGQLMPVPTGMQKKTVNKGNSSGGSSGGSNTLPNLGDGKEKGKKDKETGTKSYPSVFDAIADGKVPMTSALYDTVEKLLKSGKITEAQAKEMLRM
ncbi:hypothetical protein ACPW7J_09455 [Ihubacter sp. rT4E-8]|uniref:hypothetical protein n=1 Tax=Ihubacter sp. rT4E-8 TaxID=3242369 RepID=UPI003CF717DF